ncbi:hypothetical protein SAY87_007292 [Trapa incisa]|uniref:DUF241 domain protein n=1 Tax=Trapa incisa TaxID=236973 RepID=A0AAN7K454_9MYRT|nr:hypothetical protein SAY87_007292 [Trapa incisa]
MVVGGRQCIDIAEAVGWIQIKIKQCLMGSDSLCLHGFIIYIFNGNRRQSTKTSSNYLHSRSKMDSSSSYTIHHSRSNSLPSRPHPVISQLEESLHSIRIALETGCSSPSSLSQKLNGLENLHESVDELLLLPLVQHAFSQQIHGGWVDELLDASLRLLDLCSTAKNSLLQTREALQELHSSMRRRKGGGEQALDAEVRMYLSTRRSVQKATKRIILSLKSKKYDSDSCLPGIDNEAAVFIGLLREVEATTVALLESVFCFIAGSKPRTSSSWSIISKVMLKKRVVSKEEQIDHNQLFKQDMAMESLIGCRSRDIEYPMQLLGDDIKNMNLSIQDLEDGLEGLYRRLIKCRVSLLNILNH